MTTVRNPEDQAAYDELAAMYQSQASLGIGAATVPLLPVLAVGIVQAVRLGITTWDYWLLIVASVACPLAMLVHALHNLDDVLRRSSLTSTFALSVLNSALWPIVPRAFAFYLVLVRGAWALLESIQSGSIAGVVGAAFFGVAGLGFFFRLQAFAKSAAFLSYADANIRASTAGPRT